ncbi:MAG: hypothetical protein FWG94_10325 [Oscillospiraceae bacterium]|nr:hypothetical protein [Oscillospiraceae bacterium]
MGSIHDGHRERVKNEFRKMGLEHFPDHKILEILLYYSVPRADTNIIGHRLIRRFGSLSGVFDAPYELLCEVDGVGPQTATLIKLVSSVIRAYMDDHTSLNCVIKTPDDAVEFMRCKFLSEYVECVYMVCMGANGKVLFCNRIADGTPETVGIAPSDIVKAALRANAVKVMIAHNHPNGICNPSSQDLRTTSILFDELRRVDIELTDHIIVAQDGVYSMKKNNMFPARKTSGIFYEL